MNVLARPLAALTSFGEAARFCWKIVLKVLNLRVLKFVGETVRQAGILITGSAVIVLVCVYYGYHVSGGPVGVGKATAQSMVANIIGVHLIGMVGTQLFWGGNAHAPIGG